MKSTTFVFIVSSSSSLLTTSLAFAPSRTNNVLHSQQSVVNIKPKQQQQPPSTSALYSHVIDPNDDEAMQIMMNANNCVHSDTCSIEEATEYLNEMLHLQSDCVSGSLVSEGVCEDVNFPSEIIAGLRDKIEKQVEISNQSSILKIGFNPIFLVILAMYVSSGIISLVHNNPDAFTMQEWMYAIQGGYLDDMLSSYIKYGGLAPLMDSVSGTASIDATVVPLTLQELHWSIRDGYAGKFLEEYQNYGGFLTFLNNGVVDCDAAGTTTTAAAAAASVGADDLILTTPFTTQEWMNAVKDGYLDDMMQHFYRNGGL